MFDLGAGCGGPCCGGALGGALGEIVVVTVYEYGGGAAFGSA